MGIVSFFAGREASAGARRNERVIGEVVRAMARKGWPAVLFSAAAGEAAWQVEFLPRGDDILSAVYVTVDRETADEAPVLLRITAQVKHFLTDVDEYLRFVDVDLSALAEASWPGTRIEREHNAVHGTRAVELERGAAGAEHFLAIIDRELDELRERLRPYSVR